MKGSDMERLTANTLLEWCKEKPRSLGWNAIVAYDRSHANAALIQDYISRFEASSYLRPITARVDMSQDEAEYIHGFTLDRPRLSFENATVQWSLGRLLVKVVGGTQLTTRTQPGGIAQVIKVSSYDAVNGPDITMGLTLAVLLGSVDVQGQVAIDLSKGTEIDVNFADSLDHRRIGGEFFRAYFESLPDEQKVFVLGEVGSSEGQVLKPRNVQIRTHASAGANDPGAPDFGLGAILMFITMEGEEYGTFPVSDEELHYLIPFDETVGYSSTMLLGNEFFMRKFVEEGCRRITESPELFTYEAHTDDHGFISSLSVTHGTRTGPKLDTELPNFPYVRCDGIQTPMAPEGAVDAGFEVIFEGDALVIEWNGYKEQPVSVCSCLGNHHSADLGFAWKWRKRYILEVDTHSRKLQWKSAPDADQLLCKVSPRAFVEIPEIADHFEELNQYLEGMLAAQLNSCFDDFVGPLEDLDAFRLNSILFRDRFVFEPIEAHLPGDVLLLGRIAPDTTLFTVKPVEPLVGPGEKLSLSTEPAVSGLSWQVENIAGASGNAGAVDSSGTYTAPALADIQGFFKRVRVTATRDDYSSSALVTVLVRDLTFNPLVVVCGVGMKCEMSAAARDGSQLEWSLGGQVPGSQILPSTEPGGDHTYVAPAGALQEASTFSLDQVHVKRPGSSLLHTSYVLVVNSPPLASVTLSVDADLPEGSVRLVADLGKGPVEKGCNWTLLAGSGKLDAATGIYATDPAGAHKFALITVAIEPPYPEYPTFEGYLILPLPLTLAIAQRFSTGVWS
jgi:hypothetical protein